MLYIADYNSTGHPAIKLQDEMGRWVVLEYGSGTNQDSVHEQGTGGTTITTNIIWKQVLVYNNYTTSDTFGSGWPFEAITGLYEQTLNVVDKVILPQQVADSGITDLNYVFSYNVGTTSSASYGWGELSSITLPGNSIVTPTPSTAPRRASVSYTYNQDGQDDISWATELYEDTPTSKTLTYLREYDGAAIQTSETWSYGISPAGGSGGVTGPDGASSGELYSAVTSPFWPAGLVAKSVRADGSVVERIWAQNKPYGLSVYNFPEH